MWVTGLGTTKNFISGNLIGTDSTGTIGIGNTQQEIWLSDRTSANTIGGSVAGAANVISGNPATWGLIIDNANQTLVQGNKIGTDITGTVGLGNLSGILIDDGSTDNTIGHDANDTTQPLNPDPIGNIIAFNLHRAVRIRDDGTVKNFIRGNAIFSNGSAEDSTAADFDPGIAIGAGGRIQNSYPQTDSGTGPNGTQNYPTSTLLKTYRNQVEIIGTLKGVPGTDYFIDFYADLNTTIQETRQGRFYLGSVMKTADSSGLATFDALLDTTSLGGLSGLGYSATATGPSGTSEIEFMYSRPLLFVPGIFGSLPDHNLFSDWLMQRGFDPRKLLPDPIGLSYSDIIDTLISIGYMKDETLFVATYDWRMPVQQQDDSGNLIPIVAQNLINDADHNRFESGVDYLAYWMEQATLRFAARYPGVPLDSVDVIAHSTGGLIVRDYIQSDAYGSPVTFSSTLTTQLPKVNNFVMIGVPNYGAPQAFNPLNNDWGNNWVYQDIFAHVLDMAYAKLSKTQGVAVKGPTPADSFTLDAVQSSPGVLDYLAFVRKYVPSVFDLMTIKPFLDSGTGTGLADINSDPKYKNTLLIALDDLQNDPSFASTSASLTSRVQQLSDIYGVGVSTVLTDVKETGPVVSGYTYDRGGIAIPHYYTVAPFNESPHLPVAVWYLEHASNPSDADSGDGTVPQYSSNPFGITPSVETLAVSGIEHQGLTAYISSQSRVLKNLGFTASYNTLISQHAELNHLDSIYNQAETLRKLYYENDPVGVIFTDHSGVQFGISENSEAIQGLATSAYWGDASSGIGLAFGDIQFPVQVQLIGTGGPYSITIDGNDGVQSFRSTNSGNLASAETLEIPLTTQAISSPVLEPSDDSGYHGDNITDVLRPAFIGSAPPGYSVQLLNDSAQVIGTTSADYKGDYTVRPTASLPLGKGGFSVRAIDLSGLPSMPSDEVHLQIVAPPDMFLAPILLPVDQAGGVAVTQSMRPILTGAGPLDGLVKLFDSDGILLATVHTDGLGAYLLQLPNPLSPGSYHFTLQFEDEFGNISSLGHAISLLVVSPASTTIYGGPAVTGITRVSARNRHGRIIPGLISGLIVSFDRAMDEASLRQTRNFSILDGGPFRNFSAKSAVLVSLSASRYHPKSATVTLVFLKPIHRSDYARLKLHATGSHGIRDSSHHPLNSTLVNPGGRDFSADFGGQHRPLKAGHPLGPRFAKAMNGLL